MSAFAVFCLALIGFGVFALLVELRGWWEEHNQERKS